jgi:hypothetical protein
MHQHLELPTTIHSKLARLATRLKTIAGLAMLVCMGIGCQNSKQSLYEEIDHDHPEHWPSDLADTASKIDQRMQRIVQNSSDAEATAELKDLISWCPELAGDTDLTEQQWQPIFDLSESLRARISAGESLTKLQPEIDKLSSILAEAQAALTASKNLTQ